MQCLTGGAILNEPSENHSEYSAEQFADNYPVGMENNYWIYARSLVVRRILRRVLSAGESILEIGCGAGIVLDFLAKSGFNCRGVELGSPRLLPSVQSLAWTGVGFQELDAGYRGSVQATLLLDVIEHVPHPGKFLREVGDALPNLETIIITVPARKELWSNYDDYFGHFVRYDRPALSALLGEAGYEVQEVGYFFHCLYLPMLVFTKLGLKRRVKNSGPKALRLHRLAAYAYFLESVILPKWLIGGSLYAVAKRKSALRVP